MSSSPRRALLPNCASGKSDLQPFPYDPVPEGAGGHQIFFEQAADATQTAAREAQLLSEGRQQGLAEARKLFEEQSARERTRLESAVMDFARERAQYFRQVEQEIVQLALAIARKILHREAQLDPWLLAGLVRVALEKIDGATHVVLRVHPQNAAEWRRYPPMHLNTAEVPEILEDPTQPPDHCKLETSMGTTTIGMEVQLKEIEQGLMDLLAVRPGEVR
jgi:flagellar assembly protein FliH